METSVHPNPGSVLQFKPFHIFFGHYILRAILYDLYNAITCKIIMVHWSYTLWTPSLLLCLCRKPAVSCVLQFSNELYSFSIKVEYN